MLSVKNLAYTKHKKIIFDDISLSFNDNEIVGITGAAGSGKNSFIKLLRNIDRNYEGNILIDETDIKTTDKNKLKKIISHFSSTEIIINPEAIVKEWVLGGRIIHKKKLSPYSDTDREIARKQMTLFGLDNFSEVRMKLISETSRRMASLARVFSAQPEILLLEKPEAGLNINQRILLSRNIKKFTSTGNNIIILTSTDLNFIAASCDRIIVLADEGIAESGSHNIITGEFIKKYFNVEAVVTKNIYSGLPEIQIIEEN